MKGTLDIAGIEPLTRLRHIYIAARQSVVLGKSYALSALALHNFCLRDGSERGEFTNLMSLKDALVRHKAEEFEARDHNIMGFGTIPG